MAKGGRPTKYRDAFAAQAVKLCQLGATDEDMADFFNVGITTFERWKVKYSRFRGALKAAKTEADERVTRSLYERAIGYSHPEDKIFQYEGAAVIIPTTKHYPPETTACIFWLKNRQPDQWRDKREHEISGELKVSEIKRTIVKADRPTAAHTNGGGLPASTDRSPI